MAISEFEKQRLANIERNRKLLNSLNIDSISKDILKDVEKEDEKTNDLKRRNAEKASEKRKQVKKARQETPPVQRRSKRLAGVAAEEPEGSKNDPELLKIGRQKLDLLNAENNRKVDAILDLKQIIKDEADNDDMSAEQLEKFKEFFENSKNLSIGDYYEALKLRDNSNQEVKTVRKKLETLQLYPEFKPNDLKLTTERMTYVTFHPSNRHKLILGGDNGGNCGIFNPQSTETIDITQFKLHNKTIAKFEFDTNDTNKVYTASYDGSIRSTDLQNLKSTAFFVDPDKSGISDINFNNSNEIYYTTLDGTFGHLDLRANDHSSHQVLRLSNKKIGGFTINPLNKYQIATGSLDRTLKVWDIRSVKSSQEWNEIDEIETAHLYGTYDSRLSVSIVDWNHSNDLVCNGYDDTINIFNLGPESSEWSQDLELEEPLEPQHTIRHNCRTGRWVSILKARWQKYPVDQTEKFVIGNMNKYFDVYNRNGVQLAHIGHPLMTNVPAVCNFHQTENWIVGGGASGKVYLFT